MKSLTEIRTLIDAIDTDIAALLQRRFELAMHTRALKTQVEDPSRESDVAQHWQGLSQAYHLSRPFSEALLRLILQESKRLQSERHSPTT